ncbi:glycyl-tRNA synthetase [Radiomyces spectabilis]|uniref:glycyl-tRNA synthetase n=1 Tax=Radiomyces spectabilis TaxID=64574 RepID=UPI0022204B68|nr:glycyl-tRNA synthetase [Radiomyces spectabilis]KAI8391365.1 glycyl-tRNA synthetase [Radiomyces spectabilis]
MAQRFRALLDLCKRRGFLYQSAEIYGGLRGAYDYGPLGVELKKNILNSWWRRHVYFRDDVVGLDTSIITPHPVLKASGHVDEFTDLLVDCTLTKERFRPDKAPPLTFIADKENKSGHIPLTAPDKATAVAWQKLIQEQLAPGILMTLKNNQLLLQVQALTQPDEQGQGGMIAFATESGQPFNVNYHGYVEPDSNSPFLTDSRPFNLMFKTFLDPIDPIDRVIQTTKNHSPDNSLPLREAVDEVLRPSTVYLRPETAQGVFINFEQVVRTMKTKPPFGIAQVGKSFRNEIRLEHGIFRTPEFEQLELEYFVAPWESRHWYNYWRRQRYQWWMELASHPDNFRQRDHSANEMAHYATGCTDVEYLFPWGWGEVEGVAHRGNYDLTQHMNNSNANFEVIEDTPTISADVDGDVSMIPEERPARYVPHVVESSCGLNRAMLAFLCDAFHEVRDDSGKNKPPRTVLKLHPRLAPIKCAVMPLTGKPEFMSITQKVAKSLRRHGWYTVVESQKLKIGKRYYRHDEIGTPWCITVDYQSLEDHTVTIRDRDTGDQERVHWKEVQHVVAKRLMEGEADDLLD